MSNYPIVTYSEPRGIYFEYHTAAFLASVSVEFIHQCEEEDLITSCMMMYGRKGLCFKDVQKLKLIRHLHEDMGLSLDAVDFLLLYRRRIKMMERDMEEMKHYLRAKERMYQAEIMALRRRLIKLSERDEMY